jgi:P27 family predicted phage terminase small subunit
MLCRARQITEADRAALVALCLEWSRYMDAQTQLARKAMVVTTPSGYAMPSPYLAVANRALVACTRLWAELGLTPSSRSRVQTPAEPDDAFAEFDTPPPLDAPR